MKLKCISFFLLFISLSYQSDIVSFDISFTYFNITNKGVAVSAHDNLTEIFPVFPFCITPSKQCFNISLDNTIYQTWIPGQLLSKFFNKTYIPHPTDNVVSTTKSSTGLLDSNYVGGMFVKAEVSPYKSNNSFVFALMNEGNLYQKIEYINGKMGILRLSAVTKDFDEPVSYLDYLVKNNIISHSKFSIQYNEDLTKGEIIFGKLDEDKDNTNFCSLSKERYQLSWSCALSNVIISNYSIEVSGDKNGGEFVSFETLSQNIYAPYESGEYILKRLIEKNKDDCYIKNEGLNKFIVCNNTADISNFDKIILASKEGMEYPLYPEDIFDYDKNNKIYISRLIVIGNEKNLWKIGIPGFKGKRIAFNQEDERIEFYENSTHSNNIYKEIFNNYYVFIGIIFVVVVLILIILFCIRRSRLRAKNEVNFTLME